MSTRAQVVAVALLVAGLVAVVIVSFLNTASLKSSLKAEIAVIRAEQQASAESIDLDATERKLVSRIAQAENNIEVEIALAARSISTPPISQDDIDGILFAVRATSSSVASMRNELRALDGDMALLLSGGRPEYRHTPAQGSALSEAQQRCAVIEQAHRYLRSEMDKLNYDSPATALQLAWHEVHLLRHELFSIHFDCEVHERVWTDS